MREVISTHIFQDLSTDALVKIALERGEGVLSADSALTVTTGKRTGRSPKDRFIVCDELTRDTVDWGTVNQAIDTEKFNALWQLAQKYIANKEVFISHLRVGADPQYFLPVQVITEMAWHNLFTRHLFIRPAGDYAEGKEPWTLISVPGLKTDPKRDGVNGDGAVLINFTQKKVLLCGMQYAGEMKKAMFSVLNYFLPEQNVLPMHCAANKGEAGDVALFFGLSGTGKTTLSADPERFLIGDDEHGWSSTGVFNFEGGCYAKCIDLSKEREPIIWNAIKEGAIMENVVLDPATCKPDYTNTSLTQNTRAAYPLEHIPKRIKENKVGRPKAVIFLTCDLYGVLPPVALLSKEQAAYYFLSGYTAKVGSTEVNSVSAVAPTFCAGFGSPFLPRHAHVYADLLMKRVEETGAQVYMVNTGWTGGAYGEDGKRFSIPTTRAIVSSILSGELLQAKTEVLENLNLTIPTEIKGVESPLLNPSKAWKDKASYKNKEKLLIKQFMQNMQGFVVNDAIIKAGPSLGV